MEHPAESHQARAGPEADHRATMDDLAERTRLHHAALEAFNLATEAIIIARPGELGAIHEAIKRFRSDTTEALGCAGLAPPRRLA